jgi:hypothetical protein
VNLTYGSHLGSWGTRLSVRLRRRVSSSRCSGKKRGYEGEGRTKSAWKAGEPACWRSYTSHQSPCPYTISRDLRVDVRNPPLGKPGNGGVGRGPAGPLAFHQVRTQRHVRVGIDTYAGQEEGWGSGRWAWRRFGAGRGVRRRRCGYVLVCVVYGRERMERTLRP